MNLLMYRYLFDLIELQLFIRLHLKFKSKWKEKEVDIAIDQYTQNDI